MKNYLTRIALVLAVAMLLFMAMGGIPVFAISNPTSIDMPYYDVFYNVLQTGDWLIVADGFVHYAVAPTDYTANQAFIFELLSVGGTATLASTGLQAWEDRPISIYLTAAQVTALALGVGTAYQIRIVGNPLIFSSQVGNVVTKTLGAGDYVNQTLGADGGVASNNLLRTWCIMVAKAMQINDTPVDAYWINVQGVDYLTTAGADLFTTGIAALTSMCPILFQASSEPMTGDTPTGTGTYQTVLTPQQQWGTTVASGLTNVGVYLGISQALAGSVVLFILAIMLAVFLYKATQSGIAVLLLISTVPFVGAFLGLMPIALAFVFVIFIVVLLAIISSVMECYK